MVSFARSLVSMVTPVMKQKVPPNCGVTVMCTGSVALLTRTVLPSDDANKLFPGYVVLGPLYVKSLTMPACGPGANAPRISVPAPATGPQRFMPFCGVRHWSALSLNQGLILSAPNSV